MKKEQIIFSEISDLNVQMSYSSSLGSYVSDSSKMVSEDLYKKIIKSIPENSLAFQILTSTDHYSEKQLWTIALELAKNENYCNEIIKEFSDRNLREFTKIEVMTENKQKDEKAFNTHGGSGSKLKYRDWDILEDLPEGWIIDKYCGSPLYGFVFCTNGKSILNGGKRALVRAFMNVREKEIIEYIKSYGNTYYLTTKADLKGVGIRMSGDGSDHKRGMKTYHVTESAFKKLKAKYSVKLNTTSF